MYFHGLRLARALRRTCTRRDAYLGLVAPLANGVQTEE
ncbi:hypothetical protein MYA_5414 [Burkholderia sp. KJ006]|nr:hypothetical protein MYA_5414 [Burkholderia sp. KJ006]